jgi:ABC-2 type transport system permease protein
MPEILRLMMLLSPLHHYIEASFGILLKGAGLNLLWDSVLGIVFLGGALYRLGLWRLRGQFQ